MDESYDPIVYEGDVPAVIIVTNAGPATIRIQAWKTTAPRSEETPSVRIQVRTGDTRIVSGSLIRAKIDESNEGKSFAAVGWRLQR